jgi:hypothetical protein
MVVMAHADDAKSWSENEKFVIEAIKEFKVDYKALIKTVATIETEIALLKLKCSFWGAVSGIAAYLVTMGVEYLKRKP